MDLMHARVALRERTFLDVFDLTVRFVFSHKAVFGKVALVVVVPAFLVSWAFAYVAGWAWGWAGALVMFSFAQAPFTALASRLVFEDRTRLRDALGASFRALPRLVGARILQAMGLALAGVLFVFPMAWVGTIWIFLGEIIVLEHASVGTAFTRSRQVTSSDFGDALLAWLALVLLPAVSVILMDISGRSLLEEIFEVTPPVSMFKEGGSWLALAGLFLFLPFAATARFFFYLNFRTRAEGWDIQTRFAAIAARSAAEEEARAA
jgi:hypothetical protein